MKTILVPTDFSASAENAARYAMQLALAIQANVKLCHAYRVPAEPAYAEQSSWPLYEALTLEDNCNKQLALLAAKLMKEEWATGTSGARGLQMTYTSAAGSPFSVVNDLASDKQTLLSVMGMNGFGAIESLLIGSNSRQMIAKTQYPLFLVPEQCSFHPIKKIAFATDLQQKDIEVIHSIVGFARHFNAELLITHVSGNNLGNSLSARAESFLNDVTCKINYDKIYYRGVPQATVGRGLDWVTEFGMVDLMVMIHRKHSLLERLLKGSFTKAQAAKSKLPLLVMPEGVHPVF